MPRRADAANTRAGTASAILCALLVAGMPLLGALASGRKLAPLLTLPPRPQDAWPAASFSWPVFTALASLLVILLGAVAARAYANLRRAPAAGTGPVRSLPWWGYAGALLCACAWLVAWTRMPAFAWLQRQTFTPLWLGYVLVINALATRRAGGCPMTGRPLRFLLLFPLSAALWWVFEFLNRFAGNWHYLGVADYGALAYAASASVSFSTVLPAVLSTRAWLASFGRLDKAFTGFPVIAPRHPRVLAVVVLCLSLASLYALALVPRMLFPLLWVSPLLVLVCLQTLAGGGAVTRLLAPLARGDWRPLALPALAALQCGFFWEMWNWRSLAHWEYTISYVGAFHVFEMPLLGYAGYLPFGVVCVAVAALVLPPQHTDR